MTLTAKITRKMGLVSLLPAVFLSVTSQAALAADKLELSANVAMTSDYVWRGVSQTQEQFAVQGGFDASYNIFYAGLWGSNVDFGDVDPVVADATDVELDIYFGVKPKYRGYDFDFGAIFYRYPDATSDNNFMELKAGVSYELIKDLTMSSAVYYSPDFSDESSWTLETTAEYQLPEKFVLSATLGSYYYDDQIGNEDYMYWNIGVSRTFYEDKFKIDVRYWDTDLGDNENGCTSGTRTICDARAVVTLSASF